MCGPHLVVVCGLYKYENLKIRQRVVLFCPTLYIRLWPGLFLMSIDNYKASIDNVRQFIIHMVM